MGIRWLSGSAPDWRTDGHGFESMGSQGAKGVCDEIYGDKVICARELGRTKGNSLLSDPKPSTMRRSDLIRYAPGSCDRSRLHDRATTITSQSEKGWICYPSGVKPSATQKSLSFPPKTSADCSTSVTIFCITTSASILGWADIILANPFWLLGTRQYRDRSVVNTQDQATSTDTLPHPCTYRQDPEEDNSAVTSNVNWRRLTYTAYVEAYTCARTTRTEAGHSHFRDHRCHLEP